MRGFHSTLSRRDFMKGLGLAGAGIGTVAAVAPAFHDLDELTSKGTQTQLDWWVKERELENPRKRSIAAVWKYVSGITGLEAPCAI